MLPSGAWGKRKLRGQRLGWVRSDARGTMWARQEGLRHPHPPAAIRCPSSSSSSVSCSGKGPPGCPCSLWPPGSLLLLSPQLPHGTHFLLPTAAPTDFQSHELPESRVPVPCLACGPGASRAGPHALPGLWLSAVLPGIYSAHSWLYFPLGHQLSFLPFGSLSFFER